jgi:hypothetical protein
MKLQFEQTSWVTPEFKEFVDNFELQLNTQLAKFDAKIIDFHRGHYYFSGYFEYGKYTYYFCWHNGDTSFLYRTATSVKDMVGGPNHFIKIEKGMVERLISQIQK